MTDVATAQQVALEALATLDAHLLLVLADALEELGDTRSASLRLHAFCCPRGFNIAHMFSQDGYLWLHPIPAVIEACVTLACTSTIGDHFNVRSLEDIP
jgi:hypothetical protein